MAISNDTLERKIIYERGSQSSNNVSTPRSVKIIGSTNDPLVTERNTADFLSYLTSLDSQIIVCRKSLMVAEINTESDGDSHNERYYISQHVTGSQPGKLEYSILGNNILMSNEMIGYDYRLFLLLFSTHRIVNFMTSNGC